VIQSDIIPINNFLSSVELISRKEGHHKSKSFEMLLDFIAFTSNFQSNAVSPLKTTTLEELNKTFEKSLFMMQREDFLGRVYEELGMGDFRKGQYFTPMTICDMMAQMTIDCENKTYPVTVLDPCVGSGRMLLSAYKVLGFKGLYFGCEIDRLVYKIAVMNAYFWQIPMLILNANALYVNLSPGSKNWTQAGNVWEPSSWESLESITSEEQKKMVMTTLEQSQKVGEQMSLF